MSGLSGDFVCDLGDCTQGNDDPCEDAVSFSISAFDPDCGRLLAETFTVSREDTTPPFITEGPTDVTVDCDDVPEMAGSDAITASDNCGEPVSISEGAEVRFDGSCPNEYFLQRRWTVTDYCGNESIWEQIVTVHDVTAPEVTAATDQTVECDGMGNLDALNTWLDSNGGATATDACSGVIWSNDFTGLSDDCGTTGSATVTFTATDECGNNSSVHATFTIEDTMAPVFDAYTLTTIVECNEGDSDDPSYLPLTAQDECSDVTYTVESMCMSGGCLWTVMRIWTATDDCGNSTTVEQYLMVSDTTAPEVTAPADYIVSADGLDCSADISEAVAGSPEYSDNCGDTDCWGMSSLTVAYTDSDWTYTCNADDDNAEGTRTLIRTWSVTDNCGNVGYAEQTITVVDDTAPMGSVADDSVACAAYDAATEYGSTMESDNCDSDVVVSWEETAIVNVEGGGCYQVERTYTWTDDCDNSMSAVQTITVYDDVAPEITGDIEIEIECSEYPDNNIYIDATDDCGGVNITYLDTEVSGGCVQPEGMYLRTYTVTDECGNSSMFEQFLRLVDTTAPVLTIPADYTIECDQAIVYDDASAEDNCDGDVAVELVVEIVEGDCSQNYQIKRTWTATDDCDNESMATQTITVQDTTAPMLSIPADYTAECDEELVFDDASATDNCGTVEIEELMETVSGDCTGNYIITREFTATDDCGNMTSSTQTITVQDTTAPEFTSVPADYTVECSDDMPMEEALAMDNCGTVTVSVMSETTAGDCTGHYTIARTFTATDDCGNMNTAVQTITVQDTTAPEISGDAEVTIACEDYDVMTSHASSTDNCGEVTLTWVDAEVSGGCVLPIGQYVRTYTAMDDCGNSSTFVQILNLTDMVAPTFDSVPADYTIECDQAIVYDEATASDNCSGAEVTVEEEIFAGDCPQTYQIVRTFTAVDNCDNATTAIQTITVQDTTAPEFTSVPADYTVECSDEMPMDDAMASDNCGAVEITVMSETTAGDCTGNYTITRTFTAMDDCGNSSMATQTITVQDTTAPMLSIPADYTAECDEELVFDDASATDNCGTVEIEELMETVSGDCTGNYIITREFTATDDCGNMTSSTQTITVQDTTAPEFTSVPADYTVECSDDMPMEEALAMDNCGTVTVSVMSETTAGDCTGHYTIARTFTATDDCGNMNTAVQTITVQDTTAPEISGDAEVTIACEDYDVMTSHASSTDNCGEVTLTWVDAEVSGGCVGRMPK